MNFKVDTQAETKSCRQQTLQEVTETFINEMLPNDVFNMCSSGCLNDGLHVWLRSRVGCRVSDDRDSVLWLVFNYFTWKLRWGRGGRQGSKSLRINRLPRLDGWACSLPAKEFRIWISGLKCTGTQKQKNKSSHYWSGRELDFQGFRIKYKNVYLKIKLSQIIGSTLRGAAKLKLGSGDTPSTLSVWWIWPKSQCFLVVNIWEIIIVKCQPAV